jgi:hypothetical protein
MKKYLWPTVFCTLILLVPMAARTSACDVDGSGWQIKQLDLDVTLLPEQSRMQVQGTMELELLTNRSFGPTIAVNSKKPNMKFINVEVDDADSIEINQTIADRDSVRAAHIRFSNAFARGDRLKIKFACEGEGDSSQFGINAQAAIASWVDAWHPVPWFNSDESSLSSQAKSVGTITLHMPAGWLGVCEGNLVSRDKVDNSVVEKWRCDTAVARSFAAGRFTMAEQQVGERTIRVYRLSNSGVPTHRLTQTIADVLRILEKHYGPYPYDSYAIVEVPDGLGQFGAASLQGMILARPHWFSFADGSLPLFSHEMAHGWWGNLVGTVGPGSILCSESLAQYSAALAIESLHGSEKATEFMRFSRDDYIAEQCARGYFKLWRDGFDCPLSQLESGGWHHTLSDSKGHWVFHMLRHRVGDQLFFSTLRSLIKIHADQRMSLDHVRTAFIEAAPEEKLEQFFSQWLDQTGAPVLSVQWKADEEGKIAVNIVQEQPGDAYHLKLDLGIRRDDHLSIQTIDLSEKNQTFKLSVADRPDSVDVDPNHRLLIWTPDYGPKPLKQDELKLTAEQLKAYVGDYKVDGVGTVRFLIDNHCLLSQILPDGSPALADPIGENQFRTNGLDVTFTMREGIAAEFVAEREGRKRFGKRIEKEDKENID